MTTTRNRSSRAAALAASTRTLRAALYARISDDRAGLGLGVDRQLEANRKLAEREGFAVVGEYVDNDISAFSGKRRPEYRRLLADVEAGLVDVIVAWQPDRLHRSPLELEEFIDVVDRAGVNVETCQGGRWDLTTWAGRQNARILGAVARGESELKSERVLDALEHNAERGQSNGHAPYGWTRTYEATPNGRQHTFTDIVNPEQAEIVREITRRIIRGESLRAIATDLTARQVPTPRPTKLEVGPNGEKQRVPRGTPWVSTLVRQLALRDRNAGLLVVNGAPRGRGNWEPIVSEDDLLAVQTLVRDPARKTSTIRATKYLLSGIGRCGICGEVLHVGRAAGNRRRQETVRNYRCVKGCVARRQDLVEAVVVKYVLSLLSDPDTARQLQAPRSQEQTNAAAEARTLRARQAGYLDLLEDGTWTAAEYRANMLRMTAKVDAADARARSVNDSRLFAGLLGAPDLTKVWKALPVSRKRAVINALVEVTALRVGRGWGFNPDGIQVARR